MIEELHEEMENDNGAQKKAAAAQPAEKSYEYQHILKFFIKAKLPNESSPEKLPSELEYPGIFDEQKKYRYWVDKKGNNCFMVYARALTITLGDDTHYWRWYPLTRAGHGSVVVAELLDVCSLEVQGAFKTGYLTPGTQYEVSYLIMMNDPKHGWEDNVDFSLTLPGTNDPKIRKFDMRRLSKGRWSYFRVGEFITPLPGQSDTIDFMLRQIGKWKKGLVIMGVYIRPKI